MAAMDSYIISPGNTGLTKQKSTYNLDTAGGCIQVYFMNLINILWCTFHSPNNPKQVQNCVTLALSLTQLKSNPDITDRHQTP